MMPSADRQSWKAPFVYIGGDAVSHLVRFCAQRHFEQFALVADQNTYRVMGERLADAIAGRRWGVQVILLNGGPVMADEYQILQALLHADHVDRVYLAVGSGTITDIVRFVGSVTRSRFISVPTAPSVDAFTSATAALEIGQWKRTIPARPPIAVFADLGTLRAAPPPMIAAGFGDVLGKHTSLADWKLGHLLWGEPYSEAIAARARAALEACGRQIAAGAHESEAGIRVLFESLLESGQCIADFGSSEAASGSEHHLSHYWEMSRLRAQRPVLLHGAQVAVGTVVIARIYEQIRVLTRAEAAARLSRLPAPDREGEIAAIRDGYGASANGIIAAHAGFLDMTARDLDALKQRVVEGWDEIQRIAADVPTERDLAATLRRVRAPVTVHDLGLEERDLADALKYASYLRDRFTVLKLARLLGLSVGEALVEAG
jgi:glycerol-1-phosphate dehydrogenase [NAD(P)+]